MSLLLGVAVGLAALSWKGREVADHDWHADFVRFHPMIAPEATYQPTVGEMCAIVRARCTPDQVLVIVGGNSILLGVGQPVDKIWSQHLQEELGTRYVVVNFAFRGASPNDAGAIVAEALRSEYPRQIYIANEAPFQSADALGSNAYRFFLLDAYYKGLLLPWSPRDEALANVLRTTNYLEFQKMDLELGAKLDSWLYYRNLWNWVSYTYHFTFATPYMPHAPEAFWPRRRFEDLENDFDSIPFDNRFTPQVVALDLNITQRASELFYHNGPDRSWTRDRAAYHFFLMGARAEFPDLLKRRTLLIFGHNSPYYTSQLAPEIRARDEKSIADSVAGLHALGYGAMSYGRDFEVKDFGDRVHLTASGGRKLAAVIAPQVAEMALKLKYLAP